ncbi:MAG: DMT family transporter [Halodesulfurarchaeum sp.]
MSFRDIFATPLGSVGMFLLLALFWGSSFVAIEVGLHEFPPLYFAGVRYLLAGGLFVGIAVLSTDRLVPKTRTDVGAIVVVATFLIFANNAFLYLGEKIVSGAIASIVLSLAPVLTVVFASLALERGLPRVHEVLGFILGMAGVVVVAQPDPGSFDLNHMVGVGLVLLAAASFAAGGVLSRRVRSGMPIQSIQAWGMLSGAALLFTGALLRGESMVGVEVSTTGFLSLGYLVVFSGVLAYLIYFTLLDRVGPSQLNLVGYLEPVTAAIVAWILLGNPITSTMVLGFVLIAAGFTAIRRDLVVRILDAPYGKALEILGEIGDAIEKRRSIPVKADARSSTRRR